MSDDEAQIRDLVAQWQAATRAGETQTVLDLITDDVVFQDNESAIHIDNTDERLVAQSPDTSISVVSF